MQPLALQTSMIRRSIYAAALAISLMTGKTCLGSTNADPALKEVQQLREAYGRQDARAIALLDRAAAENFRSLADHPLRQYAEYWRLSARLAQNPNPATGEDSEQIRRFIARNADSRLAHVLRREWLARLGKTASWDVFNEQYVRHAGEEQDIACYSWQERLERKDAEVLNEARGLWLSGRSAPEACDIPLRAVLAGGKLDAEQQWARLRRLLDQGAANDVRRMLQWPETTIRINETRLAAANADPGRFLAKEKLEPRQRASLELFRQAAQRYARRDAPDAAAWFKGKAEQFPEDIRRAIWGEIATQAALQHEPRANEWFALAEGAALTDQQAEWRVRAALRVGDWKSVEAAIHAMQPTQKREAAWRFWLARAQAEQGNRPAALASWAELAREMNFYGLLAAEETGKLALPAFQALRPTTEELDKVRALPALQRSILLYQAGLTTEGLQEWRWGLRGLDDRQLIAASAIAEESGLPDRALNAADRTQGQHDLTRRYPMPVTEPLVAAARERGLDPAWVYGLVKQESAFLQGVKSSAGAIGLMQLMPTTARWVAGKAGVANYHTTALTQPSINLSLGTYYLRHVYDELADPILATAAYNAGPGRARRWRAEVPLEGAIYAETIPFNETRDYVKRVMANTWYYAGRLGTPRSSFKSMVGTVPSRGGMKTGASSAGDAPLAGNTNNGTDKP